MDETVSSATSSTADPTTPILADPRANAWLCPPAVLYIPPRALWHPSAQPHGNSSGGRGGEGLSKAGAQTTELGEGVQPGWLSRGLSLTESK